MGPLTAAAHGEGREHGREGGRQFPTFAALPGGGGESSPAGRHDDAGTHGTGLWPEHHPLPEQGRHPPAPTQGVRVGIIAVSALLWKGHPSKQTR